MKKIFGLVLCILMLPIYVAEAAETVYTEDSYSYTVSNGVATITDVAETLSGKISVPSELGGYPVTGIGDLAFEETGITTVKIHSGIKNIGVAPFKGCHYLSGITVDAENPNYCSYYNVLYNKNKTVLVAYPEGKTNTSYSVPEGVSEIGDYAFYFNLQLTSVKLPDTVTKLGKGAFQYASSIKKVTLSQNLKEIADETFNGCSSLVTCIIPEGIKNVGSYAFGQCDALKTVSIPDGITKVGNFAFYHCDKLETVTIGNGCTELGDSVFQQCAALKTVNFGKNLKKIGRTAFALCTVLSEISIPEGVTEVGDSLFYQCSALKTVTVPSSLTKISDDMFNGCRNLTAFVVPEGVTEIGNFAFGSCDGFEEITIPLSVRKFGAYVFDRTPLDDLYYAGSKEQWESIEFGVENPWLIYDTTFYYNGDKNVCKAVFMVTPQITKEVMYGHPYGELPVPEQEGYEFLGWYADSSLNQLITAETIVPGKADHKIYPKWEKIPVPLIGIELNKSQLSLKPEESETLTLTFNPSNADNKSVTWTSSDETVATVSNGVITAVNVGTATVTVTSADGGFKAQCQVTVASTETPPGTTITPGIGGDIVGGGIAAEGTCGDSATWTLGLDGTLKISGSGIMTTYTAKTAPWYGQRENIKKIVVEGVATVGSYAFNYCANLKEVEIGEGVKIIYRNAFAYDSALEKITLPSTMVKISKAVFYNCTSLTDVHYNGTSTQFASVIVEGTNAPLTTATIHYTDSDNSEGSEDTNASLIADIATLRCYEASVSEEAKTIAVNVDRFPVINVSGSLGVAIIPADGYTVSYKLTGNNSASGTASKLSSTSTSKYTLLSTGVNTESKGGGALGNVPMKIITKADATRIYVDVILTKGEDSVTYKMTVALRDRAVAGNVDIADVLPLRADGDSFVIDNEAKTITYETVPGAKSAGFAVKVNNGLDSSNRPRKLLTAKSGCNLAHGEIKDSNKNDYERYVVARRSAGTKQTYQIKVHGGADGLTYTWYTVKVTFK